MATVIRPKLSERNKYWISKHRHYELKHFCLQYPEWKIKYSKMSLMGSREYGSVYSRSGGYSDPTLRLVEQREFFRKRIELLEQTAIEADPDLAPYILKAVTEELSFTFLNTRMNIPCSRDTYYDRYRKFFWLLDQKRDSIR